MSKHGVAGAKINGRGPPLVQQSAGRAEAAGLFVPNGPHKISKASHMVQDTYAVFVFRNIGRSSEVQVNAYY